MQHLVKDLKTNWHLTATTIKKKAIFGAIELIKILHTYISCLIESTPRNHELNEVNPKK